MRTNIITRIVFTTLLLIGLLPPLAAAPKRYQIISILPKNSTIKIGGKTFSQEQIRKGITFSDDSVIEWSTPDQEIRTVCVSDKKRRTFSASSFKDKNAYTISSYLFTNKMSSMDAGGRWTRLMGEKDKQRFPEKRAALVIGNSNYTSDDISSLMNPISDAYSVSKKLQTLGFDVWVSYDCRIEEFKAIVDDYKKAVEKGKYEGGH